MVSKTVMTIVQAGSDQAIPVTLRWPAIGDEGLLCQITIPGLDHVKTLGDMLTGSISWTEGINMMVVDLPQGVDVALWMKQFMMVQSSGMCF